MSSAPKPSTPTLFCFGLGYAAGALSRAVMDDGWRVIGTCRTADAGDRVPEGAALRVFDRVHPLADLRALLDGATHLLSSVPPDAAGDPVLDIHAGEIAAAHGLRWIGYLSTTGVYGDRGGGWVDEHAPLQPTGDRGRRRVVAEARWLDLHRHHGAPVHVFRLAGIYGPGRSALDAVRSGRAQRIVNWLLATKSNTLVLTEMQPSEGGRHILACLQAEGFTTTCTPGWKDIRYVDDLFIYEKMRIAFACDLLGVPAPPPVAIEQVGLSDMALSFYADNKRVSNRRIKEELGVNLLYPGYRDGLRALLTA